MPFRNFCSLGEVLGIEHACLRRGLVGIVGEHIPAPKNQVVQLRQLHEILDFWRPAVRPLAQADRAHLRQRANRHSLSSPHQFHPRHKSRAHRAHSRRQHPQLSFWRSNTHRPTHSISPSSSRSCEEQRPMPRRSVAFNSATRFPHRSLRLSIYLWMFQNSPSQRGERLGTNDL